jgi:4-hydroxybenzoate polyprenyltransferase
MKGGVVLSFSRSYVVTMRPYLLFVSGITGIAGLALGPGIASGEALLLAAAFFLSYGFGQALTDCFQTDTDSLSAPYRPLVQGRVRRRHVLIVSLAGLSLCGTVLVGYRPANAPFAALTVLGLATYTYFKRRWWAGPFYNAWIVALLVVMGYLAAGAPVAPRQWPAAMGGTLFLAFFGYANFVLTGYYKDISADRATGYRTLPVVFGLRPSALVSDGFAILAVGGAGVAAVAGWGQALVPWEAFAGAALLVAGIGAALVGQVRQHRVTSEATAYHAIVPVVHAYVLMLAGVAALHRPSWALPLLLFVSAAVWSMARRPERAQV